MEELWEKYQRQIIMASVMTTVVILIVTILMGATKPNNKSEGGINDNSNLASKRNESEFSSSGLSSGQRHIKMMADVKGAVKSPGVYEFTQGMRVKDIIRLAGGVTNSADSKVVNFAQQLKDQQIVYIPLKGEVKEGPLIANSTSEGGITDSKGGSDGQQVNINTATQQEIQKLNGIGEKKAEQILQYRQEHGDFKKIEEIKNVKGIGDKMYEKIKEQINI